MSLIQYRCGSSDPVRELFGEGSSFAPFFAALDVTEEAGQYTVKADVPGLKKEDVHLSFDNGILTIEGERKSETEQKDKNYHRIERSYGKFARGLNLGFGVDADAIKADYKDGVLTITVPKSEKAKPKSIDISVG